MYVARCKVKGSGVFPVDMLRRDKCFPVSEEDAISIVCDDDERIVELQTHRATKPGNSAYWTEARWASFGWKVIEQSTLKT